MQSSVVADPDAWHSMHRSMMWLRQMAQLSTSISQAHSATALHFKISNFCFFLFGADFLVGGDGADCFDSLLSSFPVAGAAIMSANKIQLEMQARRPTKASKVTLS